MTKLQFFTDHGTEQVDLQVGTVVTVRTQPATVTLTAHGTVVELSRRPTALTPEVAVRSDLTSDDTDIRADLKTASSIVSPRMDGAKASEGVLRRVWDRPEEDEACRGL